MCPEIIQPYRQLIDVLSALLTPLIAIAGAIILILQYRLTSLRWRLDLYDKRYPVFISTRHFITTILQSGKVTDEEMQKFLHNAKDFDFLFRDDIKDYLTELSERGSYFQTIVQRASATRDNKELDDLSEQKKNMMEWFDKQYEVSTGLFEAYLRIDRR